MVRAGAGLASEMGKSTAEPIITVALVGKMMAPDPPPVTVTAVVADASELKVDPIVDGAFAGNSAAVETEFAKAMIAGIYPGMIISAAQRQAAWLHKSALAVAEGTPVSTLLDSGFPRLHFSRKGNVETALRNFNAARLVAIIDQLATAALEMRKQAPLAAVIAQRALLSIAVNAKRRG